MTSVQLAQASNAAVYATMVTLAIAMVFFAVLSFVGFMELGLPFWEVGASGSPLSSAEFGVPRPDGAPQGREGHGVGSGFIVGDGLILTNAHVASPASQGEPDMEPDALGIAITESEDKPPVASYIAKVLAVDGYLDLRREPLQRRILLDAFRALETLWADRKSVV